MATLRREMSGLVDSYNRVNPVNEKAFDRLQAKVLKIAKRELGKNEKNRKEYEDYADSAAPEQKKNALRLVKAFAAKAEHYGYVVKKLKKPVSYEDLGKCIFKMAKVAEGHRPAGTKYESEEMEESAVQENDSMNIERLNKTLADIENALLRKGVEQIRNIVDQASEDDLEDYESEFDEDYESELDEDVEDMRAEIFRVFPSKFKMKKGGERIVDMTWLGFHEVTKPLDKLSEKQLSRILKMIKNYPNL